MRGLYFGREKGSGSMVRISKEKVVPTKEGVKKKQKSEKGKGG